MLFILSIADAFLKTGQSHFGYADDIAIGYEGPTHEATIKQLTELVGELLDWGLENKTIFDPDKAEAMHFTRRKPPTRQEDAGPVIEVQRHNFVIKPTNPNADDKPVMRWLGVWFDSRLKFHKHAAIRAAKGLAVAHHIHSLANT